MITRRWIGRDVWDSSNVCFKLTILVYTWNNENYENENMYSWTICTPLSWQLKDSWRLKSTHTYIIVFWVMSPCALVLGYQHFSGTCHVWNCYPPTWLQGVVTQRTKYEFLLLWKPQIYTWEMDIKFGSQLSESSQQPVLTWLLILITIPIRIQELGGTRAVQDTVFKVCVKM
jgi:hypothetical protein